MIEDEMKQSFLDYSMSVIVQRALPDVRDGLKPVHRRILYSMHEAGLSPNRPFKKAATVVGDVLGKYHPHGDASVYDALVRMVQDFSLRYPLIAGQGNFGSIDGDSAAAYRYTEAKLAAIAGEMLADIDKDTVDFTPNYDDRLVEPIVLPSKLPNLLINGSSGIAVGMSTNVPPHNLREVVTAAIHLLDNPECAVDDLMRIVPGPDFPTGGLIVGTQGIRDAYRTGRGRVVMRARVCKETRRGGREQLVVTEIPYATTKTRIIEQIVDLAKKEKVTDISDLRDESDRDGIRIVIELKRGANADKVIGALYKWTQLQSTFGVIMLALEHGVPREFSLKELLERYRDHRVEVVCRRAEWEVGKARDEAHVLEGLLIALKSIDRVVKIIRAARTRESAGEKLRQEFKLSERQAEAILQMRLYRLTQLEAKALRDRLAELRERIRELEAILASPERQIAEVRRELEELLERYGDARRTVILEETGVIALEGIEAQEDVVVTASRLGFIKQIPMVLYRRRVSSGKALAGMERYENDYLEHVFVATTMDTLMFFTDDGRALWLAVGDIPEAGRTSRGKSLHQLLGLARTTRIVSMLLLKDLEKGILVFATGDGTVKRTEVAEFSHPRVGGVIAISLREGDRLIDVQLSDGNADVVLVSESGRAIRFQEADVPPMGRATQGVAGIKLRAGDRLAGMVVVRRDAALCTVTTRGFAKRTELTDFPVQKRGGLGTPATTVSAKTGPLVAARELQPGDDLMLISASGHTARLIGDDLPPLPRGAQGTSVIELHPGDRLVDVTRVGEKEERDEDGGDDTPEGDAEEPLATEQFELLSIGEETEGNFGF
ncbi:MAG: DNA gyrase subunit A [Gemmatimonadetes bacterium]|nr:DNA gyrase subunit A [Gemmatimonadota bacterium]